LAKHADSSAPIISKKNFSCDTSSYCRLSQKQEEFELTQADKVANQIVISNKIKSESEDEIVAHIAQQASKLVE